MLQQSVVGETVTSATRRLPVPGLVTVDRAGEDVTVSWMIFDLRYFNFHFLYPLQIIFLVHLFHISLLYKFSVCGVTSYQITLQGREIVAEEIVFIPVAQIKY